MQKPENCTLVIFGASGDLTKRKLIPALFDLFTLNLLPEKFAVLGVSRSKLSDDTFRKQMIDGIKSFSENKTDTKESHYLKILLNGPKTNLLMLFITMSRSPSLSKSP